MDKLDKAKELNEMYGTDLDEIMTKTDEEVEIMYPGEVYEKPRPDAKVTMLKEEILELEDELNQIEGDIQYLVLEEIPTDEELVKDSVGEALTEARNDLISDKNRLSRLENRKREIEKLISLKKEQLRRCLPVEESLYDKPDMYEDSLEEDEIAILEKKIQDKYAEVGETERLLDQAVGYMDKVELRNDIADLHREIGMLEARKRDLLSQKELKSSRK